MLDHVYGFPLLLELLKLDAGKCTLAHRCRCTYYRKYILKCLKTLKKNILIYI
jgi:hypothetical protein